MTLLGGRSPNHGRPRPERPGQFPRRGLITVWALAGVGLLAGACGDRTGTATPAPIATSTPDVVQAPSGAIRTPTPTSSRTSTPLPFPEATQPPLIIPTIAVGTPVFPADRPAPTLVIPTIPPPNVPVPTFVLPTVSIPTPPPFVPIQPPVGG